MNLDRLSVGRCAFPPVARRSGLRPPCFGIFSFFDVLGSVVDAGVDQGTVDRDATREEGVACYRLFIAGLLDLTDNVDKSSGAIVTPEGVVRRDGDSVVE